MTIKEKVGQLHREGYTMDRIARILQKLYGLESEEAFQCTAQAMLEIMREKK